MNDTNIVENVLRKILKPLIRFFINRGVTYPALQDVLKSIYIEEAIESAKLDNKRLTDSRLSLVTGIHRKEVKRIRESLETESTVSSGELRASLSAAVMAKWLSDPLYQNEQNEPIAIPKTGEAPSFEALVYGCSKDKHFRSLLDDWIAQDIITIADDKIIPNTKGFIPTKDEEEKLFFAGKLLGRHIEVVNHNFSDSSAPLFDRAVYYNGLPKAAIDEIEKEAHRLNHETLIQINQMASRFRDEQNQSPDQTETELADFHVGCYFYKKSRSSEKGE